MSRSKRYQSLAAKIDRKKIYKIDEAISLVKATSNTKFDAAIEVHMRLGIDPKKGEQSVRSFVVLPHGTGKTKKIAVFSADEKSLQQSGADIVGNENLIKEIKTTGKITFDIAISTPSMMKNLSGIAKILGPKGLMPSPKAGTVVLDKDILKTIAEIRKGKVNFKNDDTANLHQIIGKASWQDTQLKENYFELLEAVSRAKPATSKGEFIRAIYLTSSMGPAIKVEIKP